MDHRLWANPHFYPLLFVTIQILEGVIVSLVTYNYITTGSWLLDKSAEM